MPKIPFFGVSWDMVPGTYGKAQEWYFERTHSTDQEKKVADAPESLFNEYLQIAYAYGPLAAFLMIIFISGALFVSFRNHQTGISGSIIAIMIIMLASYPLQFPLFTITISLIIILAYLSTSSSILKISGVLTSIIFCSLFLIKSNKTDITKEFNDAHLLHIQRYYHESNEILKDIINKSSDPMILNIIGKNYQALGMPDSAEYYFRKSTFRCPNRMYPHYLLMKLYADSMYLDKEKCMDEANTILTMPVKIPSPAVDEMKEEAISMIDKLSL